MQVSPQKSSIGSLEAAFHRLTAALPDVAKDGARRRRLIRNSSKRRDWPPLARDLLEMTGMPPSRRRHYRFSRVR
jgi:hypothetical protein